MLKSVGARRQKTKEWLFQTPVRLGPADFLMRDGYRPPPYLNGSLASARPKLSFNSSQ